LDWLRYSHILLFLDRRWAQLRRFFGKRTLRQAPRRSRIGALVGRCMPWVSLAMFLLLVLVLSWGAWKLVGLMRHVSGADWLHTSIAGAATLARVLLAVVLGTLWALPAGLAIGLSPRLSRIFQPIVQVVASFPAPMLFPAAVWAFAVFGVTVDWGSIVLMLLGTQWYILFNVIAGAMAIPTDLREVAESYRLNRWQRFRTLYFPAVFPYLVTGWVTAAGGAWNASILAEYFVFRKETLQAVGLGAQITEAYNNANYPLLAASIAVMSLVVVVFNRTVWRRCYLLAETKFSLSK
jgi:NitT/TauT family transport system permease protein